MQVCLYTMCLPIDHGGRKRLLDPLELKSQMVVRCRVGVGIEPEQPPLPPPQPCGEE